MTGVFLRRAMVALVVCPWALAFPALVHADEVLDWNDVLLHALVSFAPPGAPQFRLAAIVESSVFDAVNGIDRRFTPIHVPANAPRGASRRAAAVCGGLHGARRAVPDTECGVRGGSREIALRDRRRRRQRKQRIDGARASWGRHVANEILAWRSTDGYDPSPSTYTGSLLVGKWRPTPPAFANGLAPSLAHTLPWVIPSPSSFRPAGPPDLTSAEYAADFNEEKAFGELTSTVRTADQTTAARFWGATALTFWNRAAANAAAQRHTTLVENARLFALLTVATADAAISCWDAKYYYELWRPITAIRLARYRWKPGYRATGRLDSAARHPSVPGIFVRPRDGDRRCAGRADDVLR